MHHSAIVKNIYNGVYTAAYINKGSHSSDSDHSFSDLEDDPRPPDDKLHPQVEGGIIQSMSPTKQKAPATITDLPSGDPAMANMLMQNLLPLFVNMFSTTSSISIRQVIIMAYKHVFSSMDPLCTITSNIGCLNSPAELKNRDQKIKSVLEF